MELFLLEYLVVNVEIFVGDLLGIVVGVGKLVFEIYFL